MTADTQGLETNCFHQNTYQGVEAGKLSHQLLTFLVQDAGLRR